MSKEIGCYESKTSLFAKNIKLCKDCDQQNCQFKAIFYLPEMYNGEDLELYRVVDVDHNCGE